MSPVLTLTYDDTRSAITATASSLAATINNVLFERSTDQIHWSQVRGGAAVTAASNAASVTDYEFTPGVVNYYRASAVDTAAPTFVSQSTAVNANNASVSPTVPAGYAEGDLLLIWAAVRNSGAGSIVVPSGWTAVVQVDNWALLGRRATASESTPTVAISGGVSGADVIAQMSCWRNVDINPAATAYQKNPSAANVTYPGLYAVQTSWAALLFLAWRQSAWTGAATLAGCTEIGDTSSALGSGAAMAWDYQFTPTPTASASGVFTITGGTSAVSYGVAVALQPAPYITRTQAAITPFMTQVWLKIPEAPYLNRSVTLVDWSDNQRASRVGTYAIHAQRDSVAYQDVGSPRTVTAHLWADGVDDLASIELVLTVGNVLLLHTPHNVVLQSMYAAVGNYNYERPAHRSARALLRIPFTEVVPPDISIVGYLVTWSTLLTNYQTWQDEITANATWQAVLNLVGTPADALVSI